MDSSAPESRLHEGDVELLVGTSISNPIPNENVSPPPSMEPRAQSQTQQSPFQPQMPDRDSTTERPGDLSLVSNGARPPPLMSFLHAVSNKTKVRDDVDAEALYRNLKQYEHPNNMGGSAQPMFPPPSAPPLQSHSPKITSPSRPPRISDPPSPPLSRSSPPRPQPYHKYHKRDSPNLTDMYDALRRGGEATNLTRGSGGDDDGASSHGRDRPPPRHHSRPRSRAASSYRGSDSEDDRGPRRAPQGHPSRHRHGGGGDDDLQLRSELLQEFYLLLGQGAQTSARFDMQSHTDDIRQELIRMKSVIQQARTIKFMRKGIVTSASLLEFANRKYNPWKFKLDGWSEHVMSTLSDYDSCIIRLYMKYKGRTRELPPELELLFLMVSSAVIFHITQTFMKQAVPSFLEVAKDNPNLADTIARIMAEKYATGGGGVAGTGTGPAAAAGAGAGMTGMTGMTGGFAPANGPGGSSGSGYSAPTSAAAVSSNSATGMSPLAPLIVSSMGPSSSAVPMLTRPISTQNGGNKSMSSGTVPLTAPGHPSQPMKQRRGAERDSDDDDDQFSESDGMIEDEDREVEELGDLKNHSHAIGNAAGAAMPFDVGGGHPLGSLLGPMFAMGSIPLGARPVLQQRPDPKRQGPTMSINVPTGGRGTTRRGGSGPNQTGNVNIMRNGEHGQPGGDDNVFVVS